ncbi:DUF4479 domain-containing protein, partial [Enterococcus faecium]|uniref:DUF4479 domain-containing protein n=1 Tax=Enterococcus faecium TaxID=1352 RepID=UPI0030C8865D
MHKGSIFDKIRHENDRGGTEMIFAYNKENVGDVLLVIVADDQGAEIQVTRVGDVERVSLVEAPETVVAWNIFNASALLGDINGT